MSPLKIVSQTMKHIFWERIPLHPLDLACNEYAYHMYAAGTLETVLNHNKSDTVNMLM